MSNMITGRVIKIIDDYHIVINRGEEDGVSLGQIYLVYKIDEELSDPETGESLGNLEIVCGQGIVHHVQPKMATLKTSRTEKRQTKTVIKKNYSRSVNSILRMTQPEEIEEIYDPEVIDIPFENIDTRCLVRRIK